MLQAIERGIHFEIQYSHAIRDKNLRKYLISNAMVLMFWCKGKVSDEFFSKFLKLKANLQRTTVSIFSHFFQRKLDIVCLAENSHEMSCYLL